MAPARTKTRKTASPRPRAAKGASLPNGGRKSRMGNVSDSDGPPPNQLQSANKRKSAPSRSQGGPPHRASKKRHSNEAHGNEAIEEYRDPKQAEKAVEDENNGEQEVDELDSGEEREGESEDEEGEDDDDDDDDGLDFQRAQNNLYGRANSPILPATGNRRARK